MKSGRDLDPLFDVLEGDSRIAGREIAEFVQPVYVIDSLRYALRNQATLRVLLGFTVPAAVGQFGQFYFWTPRGCWIRRFYALSATTTRVRVGPSGPIGPLPTPQAVTCTVFLPSAGAVNDVASFLLNGDPNVFARFVSAGGVNIELFGVFRAGSTGGLNADGSDIPGSTTREAQLVDLWLPHTQSIECSCTTANNAWPIMLDLEFPSEYLTASRI